MRSPQQLLVACHFRAVSKEEIHQFIDEVTKGDGEYDSMIFDAYSSDLDESRRNLEICLRKGLPGFEILSDEGIKACSRELKCQIERMHRKECPQKEFCEFFSRLENSLLEAPEGLPLDLLGDLYNGCDCYDDNWQFLPNEYLMEESRRVLDLIREKEREGLDH